MNQILSYKNEESKKKILKKNTKSLCIFLIIFAIILLVEGSWRLYTNLHMEADIDRPEITGHQKANKTTFSVKSNVGIDKIIYTWNNGEDNIIKGEGKTDFNFDINNRIGSNDLILKTVDVEGGTVTYDNIKIVYVQDGNTPVASDDEEDDGLGEPEDEEIADDIDWEQAIANDKIEPTISVTGEKGKLVITASDNVRMSYVLYSWNGGEETKITGLSEDEKTLSAKIDAMKGDNKIKIKAYDKAGNCKEYEKEVHGTDGPIIKVKKEDGKLKINVTDEFGITKIEYNFNNKIETIDNMEATEYNKELELIDGENFIIINAYEGNVKSEFKGKTTK